MTPSHDVTWMQEALRLAARGEGKTRPNPPVGAILVKSGRMLAGAYHRRAGYPHAEAYVLRRAGGEAAGATLYVTLEPCCTKGRTPACSDTIIASGVKRVVAAVPDPNPAHAGRGFRLLRRAGLAVDVGVCRDAAERLIAPFRKWVLTGRPYLTLKLATSLDGRIADRHGRSRWISGPASRRVVQDLRRRADAVMVGAGTAVIDNPSLLCRLGGRAAYRVIVDSSGRLPLTSRVLNDDGVDRTIVAVSRECPETRAQAIERTGASVWRLPKTRGGISLPALMTRLGSKGLLHVLCEGGGVLAESLIQAKQVDALAWFIAPKLLGGRGLPALGGPGWPLQRAPQLDVREVRRVGDDVLILAEL